MQEKTCRSIRKSIEFEESGEKFSVTVNLENISHESKKETIVPFLDTLFRKIKEEIKIQEYQIEA